MKLCKFCRHSIQDDAPTWWQCRQGSTISPVDGRKIYASCDMMRVDSRCGPEGKLFEPQKEPDEDEPDRYEWPDDKGLDDPRHGQAEGLNRERYIPPKEPT